MTDSDHRDIYEEMSDHGRAALSAVISYGLGDRTSTEGGGWVANLDRHLAEIALALAAQDGSPLADRRELVERAATQVLVSHPDADADDVLLWAEAQLQ